MPISLTLPNPESPYRQQAMRVFVVATALLVGIAQGVPIAQKGAIAVPKPVSDADKMSALVARYVIAAIWPTGIASSGHSTHIWFSGFLQQQSTAFFTSSRVEEMEDTSFTSTASRTLK